MGTLSTDRVERDEIRALLRPIDQGLVGRWAREVGGRSRVRVSAGYVRRLRQEVWGHLVEGPEASALEIARRITKGHSARDGYRILRGDSFV